MADFSGFRRGAIVSTSERIYCFIGKHDNFADIARAREEWARSWPVSVLRLAVSMAVFAKLILRREKSSSR